ncbi:uncharacterized protein LOC131934839 [Physella acuta]|uniref:uncharacterized protein LOC131934839 n=1 Tax=Physella acuta TaxID=109671 RepID=UPI0027DD822B|nr:uncharacterized protein LOC131934839 [Physella acuta]XP_059146958.1 uncharacterized protein LOC131934839 [Physella acuta]XP_059146959.1 uncharacterized protein LOC131934839 [Physella acuta]
MNTKSTSGTSRVKSARGNCEFEDSNVEKKNLKTFSESGEPQLLNSFENNVTDIQIKSIIINRKIYLNQVMEKFVRSSSKTHHEKQLSKPEDQKIMQVKDKIKVSDLQLQFVKKCFGTFENCTVKYDATKRKIVLNGILDAVNIQEITILEKIRNIKMKEIKLDILSNIRAKRIVKNMLKAYNVHFLMNANILTLASKTDEVLCSTIRDVNNECNNWKTFKSPKPIDVEELENLKASLEKKYLLFVTWTQNTEISFVSWKQDVTHAENEIMLFLKSVDDKVKQVEEEIKMPGVMIYFLEECLGVFENCTVDYDALKKIAILRGVKEAVAYHKINILQKIRSIKIKEISLEILCNVRAEECITNFLKSQHVQMSITDTKLTLASTAEDILYSTVNDLSHEFNIRKTFKAQVPIAVKELETLKVKLEKKYIVFISWTGQNTEICLVSCKQDMIEAEKEINLFLKSFDVVEKEFSLKGIKAKYVYKYVTKRFCSLLKDVEVLEQSEGEDGIKVKFKESYAVVDQVYSNLVDFVNQIKHQVFDLTTMYTKTEDLTLVVLGLNTDEVRQQIREMEKSEKCIILLNIPDNSCIKPVESELDAACQKFQSNNSFVYVKTGNLHKEKSDIIVMFLDKRDKSFDKKKSLFQHEVMLDDDAMTDDIQVFMNTDTLSPNVRAECCVLVGQHDQSSLSSLLDYIINGILQEALSLGASTISISSKTLNKLFNGTTADISEPLITAIHSFLEENDLSKVNIIVNKEDFQEFVNVASTTFTNKDAGDDDTDESFEEDDDSEDESTKKLTVGYLDTSEVQCVTVDICFIDCKESAKLAIKLQKLIETECLYTSKMSKEAMDFWPIDFLKAVEEKVKGLHLYVEMTNGNDSVSHTIKGKKQSVDILEEFFKKEIMTIIKKWPKHCITSSSTPARKTIEFLGHASSINETCPSYWNLYKKRGFWEKKFKLGLLKKKKLLVKVDEETKKAVTDLVLATWDSGKVGVGADATGLQKHTTIEVLDVRRIENPVLFQQYASQRKVLFNRMSEKGKLCDPLPMPVKSTELLENFMKKELYEEVNEHYLFHGTKTEYFESLSKHGLDPKLCLQAMLGNGIYTAEMSTKADQYTDIRPKGDGDQRSQPGTELVMLLTRVLLGNVFAITRDDPYLAPEAPRLRRPPCKDCSKAVCYNKTHEPCDSVMLNGKGCLFREFAVYDCSRCYPEYKITYKRIAP